MGVIPGGRFAALLTERLGEEPAAELLRQPLTEWPAEARPAAVDALGTQVMNELHRHLLLTVISELWVEYLTRVEALRVSIGLEAYAQRDPLVQYKARASELFSTLLRDIRSGVIGRAFNYRPRPAQVATPEPTQPAGGEASAAVTDKTGDAAKRKRHRH
jgi:preprotein translocase subunit SecA